jgi:hypothetical protein
LFERSQLLAVPSCLSTSDEDDIIEAFQESLTDVGRVPFATDSCKRTLAT